jgi:hypothetical protein
MNTIPRRGRLPALLLALCATLPPFGAALVAPAHAQQQNQNRPAANAPVIQGLEVNADAGLAAGSVLEFKVRGTPKSTARVQVRGSQVALPLAETEPGLYTGTYTVRKSEPGLQPKAQIRAELTRNGRTTASNFRFPPTFALLHENSPQLPMASAPQVERFSMAPVERMEPGTELRFTLDGTPGAKAQVQVPGLRAVPMQEEQPGRYVANYTLRKADVVATGPVVATLRLGETATTTKLAIPPQALLRTPGGGAAMGAAAPAAPLSLQVTSPGPNAVIDASQVVLQGRTAPGAEVLVRVHAIAPAAAGRTAVAQPLGEQKVQADANGNFSIHFGQARFAPGTRFDVQMSARHGGQSTAEHRLVLFQG